jgi:cytochrome P450
LFFGPRLFEEIAMPQYDPLSPETLSDPYPVYAALRSRHPVFWHEQLESWVLTRYDDCWAVLRDPVVFASDWRRAGYEAPPDVNPSLQGLDPPEHTPIRQLFMNALRAQDLDGIAALAGAEATAAVKLLSGTGAFDYTAEVARPVALRAMSRMLGVVEPEIASFVALADAIERGMDAGLVPEAAAPAAAARRAFDELMATWIPDRERPGLLRAVRQRREAAGVSEAAVWSTSRVLFLAGFSTTVSAAATMVLTLLRQPTALERLRADPRLVDSAVEELMRYDGPIQGTSRVATQDVRIGGVLVNRGQCVLALIGAANHDPAHFAEPGELLLDRRPNRHLSFGWGPHACTGSLMARSVLRAMISSFVELPRPVLAGEVHRQPRATVRYPDSLPIAVDPA